MNDLPIQTYESVVQQRDALAAENAAMKENIENVLSHWAAAEPGDMSWMMDKCMPSLRDSCIETPATDAFTRELMAKGVDRLLTESFREEIAGALADFDGMDEKSLQTLIWSGQPPEPDGDVWCVEYMTRAADIQSKIRDFASQLRKGINDAQ